MEYNLIYSDRKTISISIKDATLTVRAPKKTPEKTIKTFLDMHSEWICKNLERERLRNKRFENLTDVEIKNLKKEAKKYFAEKLDYYCNIMGLKYGRITITSAKTRFGSCSSNGNISFSFRLMLYPEPAREYVVVHELAHLAEMNHSKNFYRIVERVFPDYKERRRMLK